MKDGLKLTSAAALGFIILMLAYSNHFHNSFHFDDSHVIQTNLNIRSLGNIPSFFEDASTFSSLPANQAYRPLLTTLSAIEYRMGNGDVFSFHVSSFLFYVMLCIVYYFMLLGIFSPALPSRWNKFICIAVTAIYSVHTVNAETINYISARSDSLSTLLVVASLTVYMYRPGLRRRMVYLIPLVLAFLVKPTVAVFPLLLFAYILFFEEGLSLGDCLKRRKLPVLGRCFLKTAPSWVVSIAMLALSSKMTPGTFTPSNVSPFQYGLTQPYALLHYFISFFIPSGLSADIEFQAMSGIFDERVILGCIFIVVMLCLAVRTSRESAQRPISYGLLWFFIASIPTSCGIVPLSESMNDHRMFFPFIGLMMSVAWTLRLLWSAVEKKTLHAGIWKGIATMALILVFLGHAYGTYQRNKVWKDEDSLWHDVTLKRPLNGRGHMNYGVSRMAAADYDTALRCFEKALAYSPGYPVLHVNLGVLKDATGDPTRAEMHFKTALALDKASPASYYHYARYLDAHGRGSEAIPLLNKCLELSPGRVDARHLLMDIHAGLSNREELRRLAADTLKLDPTDPEARTYLSSGPGDSHETTKLEIAAKERGGTADYVNLSLAYYKEGRFQDSLEASREAIRLDKDSSAAYNNMCAAYNELGRWDEAVEACKKALKIDPNYHIARNNLNLASRKAKAQP